MGTEQYATIKELIEYGLDKIPVERNISVNLRDLIYIKRVLEEYMRFFHNEDHYPTREDVKEFLGTVSSGGGFEVLSEAIYKKSYKMEPKEIEQMIEDDVFEHPLKPKYWHGKASS